MAQQNRAPDASAVMARVIILKCMIVKALATVPQENLAELKKRWSDGEWKKFIDLELGRNNESVELLRQSGLWNEMGDEEKKFMRAPSADVTPQMRIDASWRVESVVCLLWALGYIPAVLAYDQQADPELTNKLPVESAEAMRKKAVLRDRELIEKQRDLAELWHWRSRTRQLQKAHHEFTFPGDMTIEKVIAMATAKAASEGCIPAVINEDFPAYGKAYRDLSVEEYSSATSIALERHRSFNWLCGLAPGNRWSETPTDT